jgi:amino acid transporter
MEPPDPHGIGDGLGLFDAVAIGIGGMIGGAIFSVLAVTIQLAGHLAFVSIILAGALALVTAHAYAGLSRGSERPRGLYACLRRARHPELVAVTTWLLILGYVILLAVYALTFGEYAARFVGAGRIVAHLAAIAVLGASWALNARGRVGSLVTQNVAVVGKIVCLLVIAGVGLLGWSSSRLTPLAGHEFAGVVAGAATIFVAYEGFELLSYDDELQNPRRTLPRPLYLSIVVVGLVYVLVAVGAQMLVGDSVIVAHREVWLAVVGQRALGTAGRWLATATVLFATSSAINATLFSTSRLVRDLSVAHELPAGLGRSRRGVPATGMWVLTVMAAGLAMAPGVTQVLAFGSLTFLVAFALVNYLHARSTDVGLERWLGRLGASACLSTIGVLVARLAAADRAVVAVVASCFASVAGLRALFKRRRLSHAMDAEGTSGSGH